MVSWEEYYKTKLEMLDKLTKLPRKSTFIQRFNTSDRHVEVLYFEGRPVMGVKEVLYQCGGYVKGRPKICRDYYVLEV